jgi:protocatechuate 3,4-dioxygenase beta subunit
MRTNRRSFCTAAGLWLVMRSAHGADVTPDATPGPFYPVEKPLDKDGDLTRIGGRTGRAQGELIELVGRVVDVRGKPIAGASVEIWHADVNGRYPHPYDSNPAQPDPGFQGYGVQATDDAGRYRFRTIKPAPYAAGGAMRTPHIHFQITAARERKVTQMFFPGEPLNEQDGILRSLSRNRESVIARVTRDAPGLAGDARLVTFDIVLPRGATA